jgi:hypothetical protein
MSALPVRQHADVKVSGSGTIYLFHLLSDTAADWVACYVSEDRQMFGASLAVEHRFVAALVHGMVSDGLVVEEEL